MYIEWCDEIHHDKKENYDFYLRVFKEKFDLKFHKPKKDKCDHCEAYENIASKTPEMIEEHTLHIEEKENARTYKNEMKDEGGVDSVLTAAFDLEKVLLCPHGPTSSFYYVKRLKLHNFTVTDIDAAP